ncbi:uncharacterized protein ACN427_008023 isoform 1-T1 [Glossina fuscipes fuscipes]
MSTAADALHSICNSLRSFAYFLLLPHLSLIRKENCRTITVIINENSNNSANEALLFEDLMNGMSDPPNALTINWSLSTWQRYRQGPFASNHGGDATRPGLNVVPQQLPTLDDLEEIQG